MWTVTLIFVLSLCALLYTYLVRKYSYWKSKGIPYEKPVPLLGIIWETIKGENIGQYMSHLYKNYEPPYFGLFIFTKPYLVLKDPELIKQVLITDFSKFPNRPFASNEDIDPIAYNSLFSATVPQWKTLRSRMSPAFTSAKMKTMAPLMKTCAEELTSYIRTKEDHEMKNVCMRYTTDAIASCAFGVDANSFKHEDTEFLECGRRMFSTDAGRQFANLAYFVAPFLVRIFRLKFMEEYSIRFLGQVFWDTVRERERSGARRGDFVDLLLDMRKNEEVHGHITDIQMLAQAVGFFGAGQDPVSTLMSLALYELAVNKDIQGRTREEITTLFKKHGEISYECMQEMKYLDMICQETLRKYPFAPFLLRECTEPYEFKKTGLVIDKNVPILIPIKGLHYDESVYPNPDKFDPERFSEDNKGVKYLNIAFGLGPRSCIGDRFGLLATKVGLIQVIKNFQICLCADTPVPMIFKKRSNLLVAENGVHLSFKEIAA